MMKYISAPSMVLWFILLLLPSVLRAQGVGINTQGNPPDPSAMLDVSGVSKGILFNRMTTEERDQIVDPAHSLMIFNTTTDCLEMHAYGTWREMFCITCPVPTNVTATPSATNLCDGNSLTLTGSGNDVSSWAWTGPDGFSSSLQSPVISAVSPASAGVYTLTATNSCGSVNSSTATITVTSPPSIANAGSDINPACGSSTATLAATTPDIGTGSWSVISGTANIVSPNSPTSQVTGLAVPGTAVLRWTVANSPCSSTYDDVTITTAICFSCGSTLTVNHAQGTVAPETKTVSYGTVQTNLSGSAKCWTTRNLGASSQGSSATDVSDNAAGWYWQFNRKQGYTPAPLPAWTITSISESGNWLPVNDPCLIELGTGWRIPTGTEWTNAMNNAPLSNINTAYSSVLKLHAGGYLDTEGAVSNRGSYSIFASSTGFDSIYNYAYFGYSSSLAWMDNGMNKAYGYPLRCIKD